MNLNKLLKKGGYTTGRSLTGGSLTGGKITTTETVVEPLSNCNSSEKCDPRVKKLKKELEKLNVAPKPKYIYFNLPN